MEQDPGRAESLWIGRERLGEEGGAGRPASFHHRRGRGGGRGRDGLGQLGGATVPPWESWGPRFPKVPKPQQHD